MIELVMTVGLKFLHFLALMLGAGAGLGSMLVARQLRVAGNPPPAALIALRPRLGAIGLVGVLLIWASGLGLWLLRYDMVDLGPAFTLKLAVSALLLGVVLTMRRVAHRAATAGGPPPSWFGRLAMAPSVLTLIAVALAAWVFA